MSEAENKELELRKLQLKKLQLEIKVLELQREKLVGEKPKTRKVNDKTLRQVKRFEAAKMLGAYWSGNAQAWLYVPNKSVCRASEIFEIPEREIMELARTIEITDEMSDAWMCPLGTLLQSE